MSTDDTLEASSSTPPDHHCSGMRQNARTDGGQMRAALAAICALINAVVAHSSGDYRQ
ncbi:MAG: hypothetical protein ACRDS0_32385 [Pseudonocardiaceae bacterium]